MISGHRSTDAGRADDKHPEELEAAGGQTVTPVAARQAAAEAAASYEQSHHRCQRCERRAAATRQLQQSHTAAVR